jgi:hypothetical protein
VSKVGSAFLPPEIEYYGRAETGVTGCCVEAWCIWSHLVPDMRAVLQNQSSPVAVLTKKPLDPELSGIICHGPMLLETVIVSAANAPDEGPARITNATAIDLECIFIPHNV